MRAVVMLKEATPIMRGGALTRTMAVSSDRMSTDNVTVKDTAVVTTTSGIAPVSVTAAARAWAVTSVATGGLRAIAGTKARTVAPMAAIGTRSAAGGIAHGTKCARGWETMLLNVVAAWMRCGSEAITGVALEALHARMSGSVKMSASV